MKALRELRLRLHRRELDRRLVQGADPASSPELELRAQELVSPRFRTRMAAALRSTIEIAERPWPGPWSAQVPLQSQAILAERDTLLDLARDVVQEPSISARGMARLTELLTDGRSPLYYPSPRGALQAALRHTRSTLLLG